MDFIEDWPDILGSEMYRLAEPITHGELSLAELTPGLFMVVWRGKPISLTFTQFKILYWLVERAGFNQPYRRLYDFVHREGFLAGDGDKGYWTNVRSIIKRIRQRFRDVDATFDELHNLSALGYRWGPLVVRPQLGSKEAEGGIVLGELEAYPAVGWVCWKEQPVELTLVQVRIVALLASRRGGFVSYRLIYDLVHGEGFFAGEGEEGYRVNVRSLIKRIRKRFCDVDATFDEIVNFPAEGYGWRNPEST